MQIEIKIDEKCKEPKIIVMTDKMTDEVNAIIKRLSDEQPQVIAGFRDDVVEALCLALEKGWGHGYIQIGPSVCTSIKEIAETVVKISGKDIEIVYDTTKPEGDKARSADYTKAKTILGWEPKIALEDGLRQQYEWVKSQIEKSGCHQ